MAALQGLSGLYADPQDSTDVMDEGVLEARAFTPSPEHGTYGSQSVGYQGQDPSASPYSDFPVYDGWDASYADDFTARGYAVAGEATDQTPDTHSAPYPRGIIQQSWEAPDNLALAGAQQVQLHQPDLGGPTLYVMGATAGRETPSDYTTDRYDAPNENVLSP